MPRDTAPEIFATQLDAVTWDDGYVRLHFSATGGLSSVGPVTQKAGEVVLRVAALSGVIDQLQRFDAELRAAAARGEAERKEAFRRPEPSSTP